MKTTLTKILLIVTTILILFLTEFYYFNQGLKHEIILLFYSKGILKVSFYIVSYIFALTFVSSILFVKNRIIFAIGLAVIGLSYLVNLNYKFINGKGFGLSELQTMLHESNKFTKDVWSSYSSFILLSSLITIAIICGVLITRKIITKKNLFITNTYFYVNALVSFVLMLTVTFLTANTHSRYPTPAHLMTTFTYYFTNAPYYGERTVVATNPTKKQAFDNIIWIVDESIGGNYLSINGYEKDTTPYLNSIKDRFINLGLASSGANCSAESNLILISGIQLNELPDKKYSSLKRPNIFQYAKKAGYKTHYISGQSNDMVLQNYMTTYDLNHIDNFYQPSLSTKILNTPEEDIITEVDSALKSNPKNFVFMVKRGAHFHWEGKYPSDKAIFKPTLKANDNLIEDNKEKAYNSYANNIKFTVDDFFKLFLQKINLLKNKKTLIIYTSDHGQSIIEGISNGTHCDGISPNISQGVVPFLLFTYPNNPIFSNIEPSKHSHFEIFPTTLKLMGYELNQGKSLFDKPKNDQEFFSGDIFGRTKTYKSSISN